MAEQPEPRRGWTVTFSRLCLWAAIVVQAIVFLALLVPFALPRVEAWQAAALLLFFASFTGL